MASKRKSKRSGDKTMGAGCALFFGVGWTLFSSVFVILGLNLAWKALKSRTWEEVPCTIERFEITADQKEDPPFAVDLLFHYEHGGKFRSGDRLRLDWDGEDEYENLSELRAEILMGPEGPLDEANGAEASCRVNPDDPDDAVLLPDSGIGILGGLIFAVFGGGFVLVGIGLTTAAWREKKSTRARSSSAKGGAMGKGVMPIGFFGVFALAGLGIFFGVVVPGGVEYLAMKRWVETPATVEWSRVQSHSGDDGTTYSVDLLYRYQFEAREYRSNRFSLVGGSSSGRSGKQEIVNAHPAGSELTVFVNPAKPWQAVVRRKLGWGALFALFPLPFMAVGLGGLWVTFRKKKKATADDAKSVRLLDHEEVSPLRGEAEFGSKVSRRWLGFLGAVLIAAFWNGIVSVFLVQVVKGWSSGKPEWMLGLFMVPFVLVGIGLILNVPYRLLAIFSPVFRLKLGEPRLRPGSRAILDWKRTGGSGTPQTLSLWLVGIEEATYRRGTNTVTAKQLFHEESLFETSSPLMMRSGRCELRLPAETAPSFQGEHNKICWYLRIVADVPLRPDVREDHEIKVEGLEQSELS